MNKITKTEINLLDWGDIDVIENKIIDSFAVLDIYNLFRVFHYTTNPEILKLLNIKSLSNEEIELFIGSIVLDENTLHKYIIIQKDSSVHNLIKKLCKLKILSKAKGLLQDSIRISYLMHPNLIKRLPRNLTTKEDYRKQLQSKEWKLKREEVLEERGRCCEKCDSTEHLQIHHKKYINGRKAWEYDNDYLEVLCRSCHLKEHTNG